MDAGTPKQVFSFNFGISSMSGVRVAAYDLCGVAVKGHAPDRAWQNKKQTLRAWRMTETGARRSKSSLALEAKAAKWQILNRH